MSRAYGVDVSHYQLDIDWKKVKAAGKQFAIMKAQYEAKSHRKDEYFEANYKGCGDNGIMRGVYIFIGTESIRDPSRDAMSLLNHLNGRELEYGIWLDMEAASLRACGKKEITRIANVYAEIFEKAGYYVGIYSNLDWTRNVLDMKALERFDFWMARYPKADTGVIKEGLNPGGVCWQYSSKGIVPGIKVKCDLDVDFDGVINLGRDKKSLEMVADEVMQGLWGAKYTSPTRKELLTAAGYNYYEVQQIVNAKMKR